MPSDRLPSVRFAQKPEVTLVSGYWILVPLPITYLIKNISHQLFGISPREFVAPGFHMYWELLSERYWLECLPNPARC